MFKRTLLYCVALVMMAFVTVPALAAGMEPEFCTHSSHASFVGDVVGPMVAMSPDQAVTTLQPLGQMEASVVMASDSNPQPEIASFAKPNNNGISPVTGPFEIGWQGSPPNMS